MRDSRWTELAAAITRTGGRRVEPTAIAMKMKVLKITGILFAVLATLAVVAYWILLPKPLQTPESVRDLAELEAFLSKLAGYN